MTDFDRPFETENNPTPEDNRVNVWVKIITIAGVLAAAAMVIMDLQGKIEGWG